jgi:hypothetical protein
MSTKSLSELSKDPTVKWSWMVKTPDGQEFGVTNLSYEAAASSWVKFRNETTDELLKEKMDAVGTSFGVYGSYGNGYQIQTNAISPQVVGEDVHWCPRRGEGGPGLNIAKDGDHWKSFPNGQRTCSYCGSLHPDDMLVLMNEHGLGAIEPSTKQYKWYIARPYAAVNASLGPIKYYRMHDTPELISKLKELLEQNRAKS